MKKIILLFMFAALASLTYSQNPLTVNKSQLNFGVGLSGWGVPFYLGLDYGVHKDITIGGEMSYRSYNENWKSYRYHHNIIGLLANVNYHFNSILHMPPQWDFYTGLNLGFFVWNSPELYDGDNRTRVGIGAQIGGRYYFNNRIGVNLEFGGGNAFSGGKFGLTIKL